ncbi:MAG: T9SS type A sorting domain-containing protein [Chitinophagales bacterium]
MRSYIFYALVFVFIHFLSLENLNSQSFKILNHESSIYDSVYAENAWAVPNPIIDFDFCDIKNSPLVTGGLGKELGITCGREVGVRNLPEILTTAVARVFFTADGDNSSTIEITWNAFTETYNLSALGSPYHAYGLGNGALEIELEVVGLPNGTPVNVWFDYDAYSGAGANPENVMEDEANVTNVVDLAGVDLFNDAGHQMTFNTPPPNFRNNKVLDGGVMNILSGTPFKVKVDISVETKINPIGKRFGLGFEKDRATANAMGKIRLYLSPYPIPPSNTLTDNDLGLFSTDIGSAAGVSDPMPNGTEYFDPGDAYPFNGPTMAFGGDDGVIDDVSYLGSDLNPNPPDPNNPPTTSVPLFGGILDPIAYADMDGLDLLDFDVLNPPNRIATNQGCLKSLEYVFLSFDDDTIGNYSNPMVSVPAASNSSLSGDMYGTTLRRDEIVECYFSLVNPQSPLYMQGVFDEAQIHTNLAPNPTPNPDPFIQNLEDDDIDALDFSEGLATCSFQYISVDHEATGQNTNIPGVVYDPGVIYLIENNGLTPKVMPPDLGILPGTDINAFEFVSYPDPTFPFSISKLALLFSVDDDDPSTAADESGGLKSNMLYLSFMNGTSFPLDSNFIYDDNIDAIATWHRSLDGTAYTGVINSIFNNNSVEEFQVYPNPAYNYLKIADSDESFFQSKISYSIYDIAGKILMQGTIHSQEEAIHIQHLPMGMYQLVLENSTTKRRAVFIKN